MSVSEHLDWNIYVLLHFFGLLFVYTAELGFLTSWRNTNEQKLQKKHKHKDKYVYAWMKHSPLYSIYLVQSGH